MSSSLKRLMHHPFGDGADNAYAKKPWIFCKACGKNTWRKFRAGGHADYCNTRCERTKRRVIGYNL